MSEQVDRLQVKQKTFEEALKRGVGKASKEILKISARSAKAVAAGPVAQLAVNLDDVLKVFITEIGDGTYMRYQSMAEHITSLIVKYKCSKFITAKDGEKTKQVANPEADFLKLAETKKLNELGESFGYMSGLAVMSSMTGVFTKQAEEKLSAREDLSEDAKLMCLSYLHDVFTIILTLMSQALDTTYKIQKSERRFFSSILRNNEWAEAFAASEAAKEPLPASEEKVE